MNVEKDFLWGLRVAQCSLWYRSDSPWVHAIAPPIEDRFNEFTTAEEEKASAVSRQLVLQVNQTELPAICAGSSLFTAPRFGSYGKTIKIS